jgi:hypothetical protein
MDPADKALSEAWRLADENYTPELYARFEELLPTLIQPATPTPTPTNTPGTSTPKGVARANELDPDSLPR